MQHGSKLWLFMESEKYSSSEVRSKMMEMRERAFYTPLKFLN